MNARNVLPPKSALTENPATKAQEAREAAEEARERHWRAPSFVRELFEGSFRLDLVYPFPEIDAAEAARGPGPSWIDSSAFCARKWTAIASIAKPGSRPR